MALFRLLLPILFPSWRFFHEVGPAPRIDVFTDGAWVPMLNTPERISTWRHFFRLFWNPGRNRALYLSSCAERLILAPTPHVRCEIARATHPHPFRIVLREREGMRLVETIAYESTS